MICWILGPVILAIGMGMILSVIWLLGTIFLYFLRPYSMGVTANNAERILLGISFLAAILVLGIIVFAGHQIACALFQATHIMQGVM